MMEDITQGNPRQIGTHCDLIRTVLFNSLTQSLLVGDQNGQVKQYEKENQSFTMIKDYGDLGVGWVVSSTQVGGFAIFGGTDYSLVAIDISKRRVFPELLKSPFGLTYSLEVCEGVDSNVYLSLGGGLPDYSSDASDWLDVTLLYDNHKKDSPKLPEEMNQADVTLRKKDQIINSLNLKIKQLKSSLQKQADQNQGTSNKKESGRKMNL